jgi:hypothetical protein
MTIPRAALGANGDNNTNDDDDIAFCSFVAG